MLLQRNLKISSGLGKLRDMQKKLENKDSEIENIKKKYVVLESSLKEIQKENREIKEKVSDRLFTMQKTWKAIVKQKFWVLKLKLMKWGKKWIDKNSKQINTIWNGNDPEEDLENEVSKADKNIEIQDEANDNTCDDLLDQTFMNPYAGFKWNECNFVTKNKSGLKKHRK